MQYFYSIDGSAQQGPTERDQLIAAGVTQDTMIWREGMAQWTRAGDLAEIADLFAAVPQEGALPSGAPLGVAGQGALPYSQPGYQPQYASMTPPTSGFAIASLVLGILGLCCCNTFIMAILAIIFGHVAKSDIRKTGKSGGGMATAGLVMGYVGLALGAAVMFAAIFNGVYQSRSTFVSPPVVSPRVVPNR